MSRESQSDKGVQRAQGIHNPPRPTLPKRMYTIKEAAVYLGISEWTLRDLVTGRAFSVVRHGDRGKIYLDIVDLDNYILKKKKAYS